MWREILNVLEYLLRGDKPSHQKRRLSGVVLCTSVVVVIVVSYGPSGLPSVPDELPQSVRGRALQQVMV